MLVLVPAHNEEHSIGDMLNALLAQTWVPDRIVVVTDNCTDKTEQIARGSAVSRRCAPSVNTDRKVGALNQGLRRWQAGYDYVAGIDADMILAPDCLQQLEAELAVAPRPGGVMARYTFPDAGTRSRCKGQVCRPSPGFSCGAAFTGILTTSSRFSHPDIAGNFFSPISCTYGQYCAAAVIAGLQALLP
jgi:glycosyltransferase involved in cell wall biosynthesis